jgi:hypothetical protein
VYPKPKPETSPLSLAVPDRLPAFSPAAPVGPHTNRRKLFLFIRLLHTSLYTGKFDKHLNPSRPVFSPADAISFRMRTSEKTARNPFRFRTSKTQDLKSFRIRTYEKTPGGVASDSHLVPSRCLLSNSSVFSSRITGHGTSATASPRASAHSASLRYPLSRHCPSTSNCPLSAASSHQSRITTHFLENFYPPARDLRHNPAAQGRHPQPIPLAGRIQ